MKPNLLGTGLGFLLFIALSFVPRTNALGSAGSSAVKTVPVDQAELLSDLNTTLQHSQWDEALEISRELLAKNPRLSEAKFKGAYALFQKGYSNAALLYLKKISPDEWKSIPQGKDRLAEVTFLFQKKVPLNLLPGRIEQISVQDASPFLADEIFFAKGRQAFEEHKSEEAKRLLNSVSKRSRFYGEARYILATLALETGDYKTANDEFSAIFQPTVFDQSSEFWKDVGSQITSHWGTNFRVLLDTEVLTKANTVAELALLGLARVAYAKKEHQEALALYQRVQPGSSLYPEAAYEKSWTLLAMNRHDEAQTTAAQLSMDQSHFLAVKARILRALILADAKRPEDARAELKEFDKVYNSSKGTLEEYLVKANETKLPVFLQTDLKADLRLQSMIQYHGRLQSEMKAMAAEDVSTHPSYSQFVSQLETLQEQARVLSLKFVTEHVKQRLSDLESLRLESKLIRAETYLEDREILRAQFKDLPSITDVQQKEHDERLVKLLGLAIEEAREPYAKTQKHQDRLGFRQSELLWELGNATIILAQGSHDKKASDEGEAFKRGALKIAQDLYDKDPHFEKTDQILFFIGFAHLDFGEFDKAAAVLRRYAQAFPRHIHIPDAYRILGDLAFDRDHFSEAESDYKKVLEFPGSALVGYALYKLGWCSYYKGDYSRALLGFEKSLLWASAGGKAGRLLSLRKEARHDLTMIYAEVGNNQKAREYFARFSDGPLSGWLIELARQLDSNGQYEKAQDLYQALSGMNLTDQETMEFQAAAIIDAYKLQKWNAVVEGLKSLDSKYRPILSAPSVTVAPINEGISEIEKSLREVSMAHHYEFKNSEDPEIVKRTIQIDEIYLNMFSKWPGSEEPLYRYAQYLLQKNKLEESRAAFEKYWKTFSTGRTLRVQDGIDRYRPDSGAAGRTEPRREEALRNLIHVNELRDENQKPQNQPTADAQNLLNLTKLYIQSYPQTKYNRAIGYLMSKTALKYGLTEEGIALTEDIFEKNPADDVGRRAFQNLRTAYYLLNDWKRAYEWSSKLEEHKKPEIQSYRNDLQVIREESAFLWAENLKDDVDSARLFVKISEDKSMMKIQDKCLYNAFIKYRKGGKKTEALEAADRLEKLYPQYEGLKTISGPRAALYQEAGDYIHALGALQRFLRSADDKIPPETVSQAQLNAGLISEALENWSDAKLYYQAYQKRKLSSVTAAGGEAEKGLKRIEAHLSKRTASEFKDATAILHDTKIFESKPIPARGELPARIKAGADKLQTLSQKLLKTAQSEKTSINEAVELYCTIPFLYISYGEAVVSLGGDDKELSAELKKVAGPLTEKAAEFAKNCITQAGQLNVDGPRYRMVMKRWGWQKDEALRDSAEKLLASLEKKSPWIEPAAPGFASEDLIVGKHLQDQATPESWYALAKLRWQNKKWGLSRLTFVDALSRDPHSGRLLNGLTLVELNYNPDSPVIPLFERAFNEGSFYAAANLAIIHLKAARIEQAIKVLRIPLEKGFFDQMPDIKDLLKGVTL